MLRHALILVAGTCTMAALASATVPPTSSAWSSAIAFRSTPNGHALTSLSAHLFTNGQLTVLHANVPPSNPSGTAAVESGAQILYTKSTAALTAVPPHPLVTVSLVNTETGVEWELMSDFDPIAQKCSCYWVDAKELVEAAGDGDELVTSNKYRLRFRGASMDVSSGYFGIKSDSVSDGNNDDRLAESRVGGTVAAAPVHKNEGTHRVVPAESVFSAGMFALVAAIVQ